MREELILKELDEYTQKLINEFNDYHNKIHKSIKRRNSYYTIPKYQKVIKYPEHWLESNLHNPFYVRKHRRGIAHSISKKIESSQYSISPQFEKEVPKKGGGFRKIVIFTIPDQVVSLLLYKRLLSKNKHRFSSFAYAYRADRNVHYAIRDMTIDLDQYKRIFIAEFDFKSFFDSIDHTFLKKQFDFNGFVVSENDRVLIDQFLSIQSVGIPQGTSISLFLANMVCWELDKMIEVHGMKFARYADDTIIWTPEYTKINKSFEIIDEFSKESQIGINYIKSEGISHLVKEGLVSEFNSSKNHFNFLGYKIAFNNCFFKDSSLSKIKNKIGYILYSNLIQPIKGGIACSERLPWGKDDFALTIAIMQIRRYLYGQLNDYILARYISGHVKFLRVDGLIRFYPLINDMDEIKKFDGWLISIIYRAMRKRLALLAHFSYHVDYNCITKTTKKELVKKFNNYKKKKKKILKIPSLYMITSAISKKMGVEGLTSIIDPQDNEYSYE